VNEPNGELNRTFDAWLTAHGGIVVRTARGFATGADRDDLEQEILFAIWRAIPAFRGGSSVSTFLYRVAHNAALTWKRAERGRTARELRLAADLPHAEAAAEPTPETDTPRRLDRLYEAIHELAPLDRSLLLLSLDGVAYAEMAEIHGISTNLVGVRLNRARRVLTTKLQGG
jgi:RNA polymerase sigma-70 factor (ECF subfamily)